ncbi:hypothetical protein FQR65_LT13596 [Abscondita terminalis]|nr:hypothetical protein FQR65_LT13596 [Abscondita terminalis]
MSDQNIKNSLFTYKDESLCPCSGADLNLLELKLTELETDNNKKYIRIVELMDQNELLKEKLESNQIDKIQSIKVEDVKYTLSKEFASLNSKTDELEKELYYMNKVHEECDKEHLWLSSLKNDSRKTVTLKEPFDANVDDFLNETQKTLSIEVKNLNKLNETLRVDLRQVTNDYNHLQSSYHPVEEYNFFINNIRTITIKRDRLAPRKRRITNTNLQFEIGLLEKEIHAPKKGNHEFAQEQFDKLRQNIEKTDELLQYEKRNSESFKEQNTKLITEINQIKSQTLKKKVIDEEKSKEIIDKFMREIEELQMEKKIIKQLQL